MSGQNTTKKSSSRKSVVIISVVARPNSIPCVLRKTIPKVLPPTADGVIHDMNSQSISTFHAFPHGRSRLVSVRKRQVSPKSRPSMKITPKTMQSTARGVKSIERKTSERFSFRDSSHSIHATTPSPMTTGSATFHHEKGFLTSSAVYVVMIVHFYNFTITL